MKKRPIAVTVIAGLLILGSCAGIVLGLVNTKSLSDDHYAILWIVAVNAAGMVAGGFILRGENWARWLAVAWIGFHVVITLWNPWQQRAMHWLIFGLIVFGLFRQEARKYFGARQASA